MSDIEAYIRESAKLRGIDPEYAVRVARSEGLAPGVWQSKVMKNGMQEPSFGPFQLLLGDGKNFPKGMGNDFMAQTGLNPSDPSTVKQQVDFALDGAAKNGWSAWYGAKNAGINKWDGIGPNATRKGVTLDTNPLQAAVDRSPMVPAAAPVVSEEPTMGDKLGKSLFGDDLAAKLKTLNAPATDAAPAGPLKQGLGLLTGLLGNNKAPPPQPEPMPSIMPQVEQEQQARTTGAQQLMAQLLRSRKRPGLTLNTQGAF